LRLLAWAVEARGLHASTILSGAGIEPGLLGRRGARVPIERARRAWVEAARRLDDSAFGLRAAGALGFGSLDLIDYLARHSATAGEAIAEAVRYMPLMTDAGRVWLVVEGREARLRHHAPGAIPYVSEMMVAVFARRSAELFGRGWSLRRVSFMHAPLAPLAAYQRELGVPVRFGSPYDEIVFDRELMDLPIAGADARLKTILTTQAAGAVAVLAPAGSPAPVSPVAAIERALGDGLHAGNPGLTTIADRLGISARTVQRRLRSAGLTHRELLRESRLELARRALDDASLTREQIARALGYASAGSFHRAFKRWSGMTPGAARGTRARAS
jgi:AraC-like DNA-binding protein